MGPRLFFPFEALGVFDIPKLLPFCYLWSKSIFLSVNLTVSNPVRVATSVVIAIRRIRTRRVRAEAMGMAESDSVPRMREDPKGESAGRRNYQSRKINLPWETLAGSSRLMKFITHFKTAPTAFRTSQEGRVGSPSPRNIAHDCRRQRKGFHPSTPFCPLPWPRHPWVK